MSNGGHSRVGGVTRYAGQTLRKIVGPESEIEGRLQRYFAPHLMKKETGDGYVQYTSSKWAYVKATKGDESRLGVFMKGSCDLPAMFLTIPQFRQELKGQFAMYLQGGALGISGSRPDILLQTRQNIPEQVINDTFADHMRFAEDQLGLDYFQPVVFSPTFELPMMRRAGSFPKSIVVLSIASSVVRTAYRHRKTGILVDPGGFWLSQSMESALKDLEVATWFKENFQSVGKLSIDDFLVQFAQVIRDVRADTEAPVMVFNTLVVDTGNPIHNYQFARNPQNVRRRDFDLALRELSRQMDFHILDIDRILKTAGIERQVDFAHPTNEAMQPIADEAWRIMRELEVC
ncbi:MAG: hypothetical protein ACLPVF_07620 [Acidimicrobiales bacterium]